MQHAQTWDLLREALDSIEYKREQPPGDRFRLDLYPENNYARLLIFTYNPNTYYPDQMRHTRHEFVVPLATYNKQSWIRWVFDCILKIETHETTEFFFVNDERVYAPHHGNGWDPYQFWPSHDVSEKKKAPGDD